MKVFCDLTGNFLPSNALEELLSGQGRVLTTTSVCNLLTDLQSRPVLYDVLWDADTVCLDFVTLTRTGDNVWEVTDLRPDRRRATMEFFNHLPWEVGQTLNVIDDEIVSTWVRVEAEMDCASGDAPSQYSADDLRIYEQRIVEQCGRSIAFTFDFVMEVLDIMDDIAIEQFVESMGEQNKESPRDSRAAHADCQLVLPGMEDYPPLT